MTLRTILAKARTAALIASLGLVCSPALLAQGPLPDAPPAAADGSALAFVSSAPSTQEHRFWDKQNSLLFAAAFALNGADFAVTRSNLQSGGQEMNPLVRVFGRSTMALAANFAGEGVGTVALSYLFHRTGHHKLERSVSYFNISGSVGAVGWGLSHR